MQGNSEIGGDFRWADAYTASFQPAAHFAALDLFTDGALSLAYRVGQVRYGF